MKIYKDIFRNIIAPENLFLAWDNFRNGKQKKEDVRLFEWNLEENIFELHRALKDKTYKHRPYEDFYIHDPKQRHIHKASVRDRILHHAIFYIINPIFEPTFIAASFSCRVDFGTHKGTTKLEEMLRKVSRNNTRQSYVLKCDIKKFFDTIDHDILLSIIRKRIKDDNAMWLLEEIIESFISPFSKENKRKGLPIGNLTSQLFANIYMNEFDQFVKHKLKVKYYARYTDDFAITLDDKDYLQNFLPEIKSFLRYNLELILHPTKIIIRKFHKGVDFLGQIVFPNHRLIRTKTKHRMFVKLRQGINRHQQDKISKFTLEQSLQSYLGALSHTNAHKLSQQLTNQYWFWLNE